MKNLLDDKILSKYCIRQANLHDEYAAYLFFLWYKSRSEYFGKEALVEGFNWDEISDGYKKGLESHFTDFADELMHDFIKEGGNPYFPNKPNRDYAVGLVLTSNDRDDLDLNNKTSFRNLAFDTLAVSILFRNYEEIHKTLKSDLTDDFFISLNEFKDEIIRQSHELIGYWIAKGYQIRAIMPGAAAKRHRKQERVAKVKDEVEKNFKIKNKKIQIPREWFYEIVQDSLGYKFPIIDYKTAMSYKKEIESILSEEKGEEIRITLKKAK